MSHTILSLLCSSLVLLCLQNSIVLCTTLDPNLVKNNWIPTFSKKLLSFSDEVLAGDKIQQAITDHRKNNVMKVLSKDVSKNEVFMKMYTSIENRFEDVKKSVLNIKRAAESTSGSPQDSSALRCCMNGPKPGLSYESRLRQNANRNRVCAGSRNGTAIPKIHGNKFFSVFKNNYDTVQSVLWQYYASVDGDFVEYPDSNNHQCDTNGNTISPLTEDWFAVKMAKVEKNLVIVYDVGSNTGSPINGKQFNDVIMEAVKETLQTLTPNDKVNVVAFNDTAYKPEACSSRLFIANQRNKDMIEQFLQKTNYHSGPSNYTVGLEAAYTLLQTEQLNEMNNPTHTFDIVMFITDGRTSGVDTSQLFTMINSNHGNKIFNLVFSPPVIDNNTKQILVNIAEQQAHNWPVGFNISSLKPGTHNGKKGFANFIPNIELFPTMVATGLTSSTPETINTDKSYTVVAPVVEDRIGLKMTIAVPVVDISGNNSTIGTAAIDVSMATIFTEIEDFVLGVHSYAFLLEKRHGHVLLHPKLKDPAASGNNAIFPTLQTLEPTLSQDDVYKLMKTTSNIGDSFTVKIKPGRSTFMTNNEAPVQDATAFYRTLTGTQFVIVMVMFDSDAAFPELNAIPPKITILNSPYHRVDISHAFPVCSIDGHVVATPVTTVKFSPSVFTDSEVYKFEEETVPRVSIISKFLTNMTATNIIKEDLQKEIWYSLIDTQHITDYWRDSKKQVIERFFGTPYGVFRMYPGVALSNTFDHVQYNWYKKTVARHNDLIFSSGKVSEFTPNDVIILSRVISENKGNGGHGMINSMQGVVGATMTHRQLTGLLFNDVEDCVKNGFECHLLDDQGFFLTHGTADSNGKHNQHLNMKFPWLANLLIQKQFLQPVWCTSMSEGKHTLSYSLQVTGTEYDLKDTCRDFVLSEVIGTNLFLLVVYGRKDNNCKESITSNEVCQSCDTDGKCVKCIGEIPNICQCPCFCDVDFDNCSSQFKDVNATVFPHEACYYAPLHQNLTETKSPAISKCDVPCQAIEDKVDCDKYSHCRWNATAFFPLCVYDIVTTTTTNNIGIPTKKTTNIPTKPDFVSVTSNRVPPRPSKPQPSNPTIPQPTHKTPPVPSRSQPSSQTINSSTIYLSTTSIAGPQMINNDGRQSENDVGLVVGLVFAILFIIIISVFVVFRFFGKRIQRALAKTTAGKYVRRNSVVDRVMFSKVHEDVIITKAPINTSVPYGQMK